MDKFALTAEEGDAFKAISDVLRTLPTGSQYNVLRNLAHSMNREVVGIGAVRAAAAVAGSVARVQVSAKPGKALPKGQQPRKPAKQAFTPEFLALESTVALLNEQSAAKDSLAKPPTVAQLTRLREASKALREAWCGCQG